MEEFGALTLIWMMHALLAAALTAPVVFFGRRRVHWLWWESAVFILPFSVWTALSFSDLPAGNKSLGNLVEPFYFSFAILVAAIIRVAIGNRPGNRIIAGILVSAVCGVAAAVFFFVPSLPE
jgi:hypothetical protein